MPLKPDCRTLLCNKPSGQQIFRRLFLVGMIVWRLALRARFSRAAIGLRAEESSCCQQYELCYDESFWQKIFSASWLLRTNYQYWQKDYSASEQREEETCRDQTAVPGARSFLFSGLAYHLCSLDEGRTALQSLLGRTPTSEHPLKIKLPCLFSNLFDLNPFWTQSLTLSVRDSQTRYCNATTSNTHFCPSTWCKLLWRWHACKAKLFQGISRD